MDWYQGWQFDDSGALVWHGCFGISNGPLMVMYNGDSLMHLIITDFCERGVKVGAA